LIVLLTIF